MTRPLVVVTWRDTQRDADWHYGDEQEFPTAVCLSVGWLVYQDQERIVLARDTGPEHDSGGALIAIPRPWADDVRVVE